MGINRGYDGGKWRTCHVIHFCPAAVVLTFALVCVFTCTCQCEDLSGDSGNKWNDLGDQVDILTMAIFVML